MVMMFLRTKLFIFMFYISISNFMIVKIARKAVYFILPPSRTLPIISPSFTKLEVLQPTSAQFFYDFIIQSVWLSVCNPLLSNQFPIHSPKQLNLAPACSIMPTIPQNRFCCRIVIMSQRTYGSYKNVILREERKWGKRRGQMEGQLRQGRKEKGVPFPSVEQYDIIESIIRTEVIALLAVHKWHHGIAPIYIERVEVYRKDSQGRHGDGRSRSRRNGSIRLILFPRMVLRKCFQCESLIDFLHLLKSGFEFGLVLSDSHLQFKRFHDFAYVFELIKHFLVVAAALRRGTRADEGCQLVVELHLPLQVEEVPHFFFGGHGFLVDVDEDRIGQVLFLRPGA